MAIPHKQSKQLKLALNVNGETIQSASQLTILGCKFTTDATPIADLNHTLKICYSNLEKIKKVQKYLTPETRSHFIKAYVLSRLQYMCVTSISYK